MKQIDWMKLSAIAEILSAMAIVATLMYLAVQTQYLAEQTDQNNQLLEAQTRRERLDVRMGFGPLLLNQVNIAAIMYELEQGEPVTELEEYYFFLFEYWQLANLEWQFDEYQAGSISLDKIPFATWRDGAELIPLRCIAWANYSSDPARTVEFVDYMNEHVYDETVCIE